MSEMSPDHDEQLDEEDEQQQQQQSTPSPSEGASATGADETAELCLPIDSLAMSILEQLNQQGLDVTPNGQVMATTMDGTNNGDGSNQQHSSDLCLSSPPQLVPATSTGNGNGGAKSLRSSSTTVTFPQAEEDEIRQLEEAIRRQRQSSVNAKTSISFMQLKQIYELENRVGAQKEQLFDRICRAADIQRASLKNRLKQNREKFDSPLYLQRMSMQHRSNQHNNNNNNGGNASGNNQNAGVARLFPFGIGGSGGGGGGGIDQPAVVSGSVDFLEGILSDLPKDESHSPTTSQTNGHHSRHSPVASTSRAAQQPVMPTSYMSALFQNNVPFSDIKILQQRYRSMMAANADLLRDADTEKELDILISWLETDLDHRWAGTRALRVLQCLHLGYESHQLPHILGEIPDVPTAAGPLGSCSPSDTKPGLDNNYGGGGAGPSLAKRPRCSSGQLLTHSMQHHDNSTSGGTE